MQRITTRQVKAARVLLAWSQADLARAARVSPVTVQRFEIGGGFEAETYFGIVGALEDAGIIFIPADARQGEGLRLSRPGSPSRTEAPLHVGGPRPHRLTRRQRA